MSITIGLAGITGKFGRLLASHLLKTPHVSLRGYCRDPNKVESTISSSPQTKLFQGGAFDKDKISDFVKGCDVVICSYNGDAELLTSGQKELIDACETEGVSRYIASDWSLDYTNLNLGELFPKDPMKHVKAYIETKEKVKGVHILIGGFMDTIFSPYFQFFDPETNAFRYWGNENIIWEGTSYSKAAEYTAAVALDSTAIGIQKFLGDRKSTLELAESFEKVYGIKPKLECRGSLDELKKLMEGLRAQYPNEVFKYMALYYHYYMADKRANVGPDVHNARYPDIKPETWENFMKSRSLKELTGSSQV